MIFVDNISQLWYYTKTAAQPCYCEHLVYPNDIILQGILNTGYTSGFSFKVEVYSPDGLTVYENASAYFSFYIGVNTNGVKFFNLRCEEFSPQMCIQKCYILRVTVSTAGGEIFNKFTEMYCQTSCCDIPRGITIAPDGTDIVGVSEPETEPIPYGSCGVPLLRIRTIFECIDNETGFYYGIPTSVLHGTANFSYENITNFAGKIRRAPRDINRLTSYNCNLQRSESFKPYILEGNSTDSILPEWKFNELENMLHASYIEINDFGIRYGIKEFQFAGGAIGERFFSCWDLFKINITLQDCTVRTEFGCGDCETISAQEFLIPQGATGNNFYTQDKQPVGDFEDLLDYFENIGFTVTDTSGEYDNTYGSFTVQGGGVIPTFYYDYTFSRNKVFGTTTPIAPVVLCAMPVLGTPIVEDDICTTPVLGTPIVTDEAEETADIYSYGRWTVDPSSEVILSENYGRLYLTTEVSTGIQSVQQIVADTNTADITVPDGDCLVLVYGTQDYQRDVDFTQTGNIVTMTNGVTFAIGDDVTVTMEVELTEDILLVNEVIGVIANNGWPGFPVEITTDNYTIMIDLVGNIIYNGYANASGQIIITNLYYTL